MKYNLLLLLALPPAHPPATHRIASSLFPANSSSTFACTISLCLTQSLSSVTTTFASASSFGVRSIDTTHYKDSRDYRVHLHMKTISTHVLISCDIRYPNGIWSISYYGCRRGECFHSEIYLHSIYYTNSHFAKIHVR